MKHSKAPRPSSHRSAAGPRSFSADQAPLSRANGARAIGRATLRGLGVALAAGLLLSALAALAATAAPDPNALLAPLSLAVLGLSALLGGLVAYRGCRTAPLLCGVLLGAALLLLFFLLSYLVPATESTRWSGGIRWGLRGGVLLFSLLGAAIGSYAPRRRVRRRRK